LEVLLAVAIFAIGVGAAAQYYISSVTISDHTTERSQALLLAREGVEAVRSIGEKSFTEISEIDEGGLELVEKEWKLTEFPERNVKDKFTRKITIEDVRENDDPVWEVVSEVSWKLPAGEEDSVKVVDRLTRWKEPYPLEGEFPEVEGLILHLDANSIEGKEDGDRVTHWEDLSGNGFHFTTDLSQAPFYKTNRLGGLPVMEALEEEVISNEEIAIGPDYTIFIVWSVYEEGDEAQAYAFGAYDNSLDWHLACNDDKLILNTGEPLSYNKEKPFDFMVNTLITGEEGVVYEKGEKQVSGNTGENLGEGLTIFGRHDDPKTYGGVAEILIYESELFGNEREKVEDYLIEKWEL